MVIKIAGKFLFAGLIILLLSLSAYAEVVIPAFVNVSDNLPPTITSIATFSSYTNASVNTPSNNFSASRNRTVYVQINLSDPNGFEDVRTQGYVKVKIVLWNTTDEEDFDRFGPAYVDAAFESGSVTDAVYTFSYVMESTDETRTGEEIPPKFYRVKAEAFDGTDLIVSNTSEEQIGTYTYRGMVLFNLSIDIPNNKKTVNPGDTFYATVKITKISPPGLDNVSVTYTIIDPENRTVDTYTEDVPINNTAYRLPLLYVPRNAMSGQYTFSVLVMYMEVGSWTDAYFKVADRRGIGSGGHALNATTTTTTTIPQKISLDFYDLQPEVYALQGETKPFMAIIENTGNVTVTDVKLELTTSLKVLSILPEAVTINPGERKVFIIEVEADENVAVGEYPSVIKIVSPKIENQANIKFIVSENPSDYRKKLAERIDDLTQITENVWDEAVKVSTSENTDNVSAIFNLLQASRDKLGEARDYMRYAKYNDTEKALSMAIQFIQLGVIELSKIKEEPQNKSAIVQTVVQTKLIDLNWVVLASFFAVVVLFILLMRRNSKLGEQVREFYDLGRIKGMIFGKSAFKNEGSGNFSGSNKGKLN